MLCARCETRAFISVTDKSVDKGLGVPGKQSSLTEGVSKKTVHLPVIFNNVPKGKMQAYNKGGVPASRSPGQAQSRVAWSRDQCLSVICI